MSAQQRLAQLAISPTGFVFDPVGGATFTVNETGRAILEGVRDGAGLAALVATLQERFALPPAAPGDPGPDLAWDVLSYVRLLRENGLLPHDFELH